MQGGRLQGPNGEVCKGRGVQGERCARGEVCKGRRGVQGETCASCRGAQQPDVTLFLYRTQFLTLYSTERA